MKISKILYNHHQEVSGIVKLKSNKLTSDDIYNYFELSEQIRTHVLFTNNYSSKFISQGFILQKMPDCDLEKLSYLFKKITNNNNFFEIQNSGLNVESVYKIFSDLELEVECNRTPIQFFCRCSLTQFMSFLKTLGKDTIIDMKEKNQRTLTCQTCLKKHVLKDQDFIDLINSYEKV